jgi:acylphosphatase
MEGEPSGVSDRSAASERVGFHVSGRVQGVGFRWSTARQAELLGVRGSVRNRSDGSVEVSAEGSSDALRQLAEWLARGPRGARVERVEKTGAGLPIPETGFQIL